MAIMNKLKRRAKALMGDKDSQVLLQWKDRYKKACHAYDPILAEMELREKLYDGTKEIYADNGRKAKKDATNVRNIVFELIESQVDSNIPHPKVCALEEADEVLATAIENSLRNDTDRLPFEYLNDEQERTVPIQGGSYFYVQWDSRLHTHTTTGDIKVVLLHPKQVVPQDGVTDLDSCDYVFIRLPQTKEYIKERYGVDVQNEGEDTPEAGYAYENGQQKVDTKVTQVIAYYRGEHGHIGRVSWVNDVLLEHVENFMQRRVEQCTKCGAPRIDGAKNCICGSKSWKTVVQDYEELDEDIALPNGAVIPAYSPVYENGAPVLDEQGMAVMEKTRIPYYTPSRFPLVLRKNVSVFGKLLGDSDVDKIRDPQELIKKLGTKIEEKLLKGGSAITLPKGVSFRRDDGEFKTIEVRSPSDTDAIKVMTLQPNISYDSAEKDKAYYEAKSTLGITDSFQGKSDKTATSGVAKQIAAAQSAGRLESKRTMKNAAYAWLYEMMFQYKLAYADEPRPWAAKDNRGHWQYGEFNKYLFLKQDAAGEWYYEDRFTFSCDASGSLANNREAMWQETRMNYQQGAFGDPGSPRARLQFWTLMETLHYPMAAALKAMTEEEVAMQEQQMAMQQQQQQMMMAQQQQAEQQSVALKQRELDIKERKENPETADSLTAGGEGDQQFAYQRVPKGLDEVRNILRG